MSAGFRRRSPSRKEHPSRRLQWSHSAFPAVLYGQRTSSTSPRLPTSSSFVIHSALKSQVLSETFQPITGGSLTTLTNQFTKPSKQPTTQTAPAPRYCSPSWSDTPSSPCSTHPAAAAAAVPHHSARSPVMPGAACSHCPSDLTALYCSIDCKMMEQCWWNSSTSQRAHSDSDTGGLRIWVVGRCSEVLRMMGLGGW